jgi:hypothetical protein
MRSNLSFHRTCAKATQAGEVKRYDFETNLLGMRVFGSGLSD